MQSGGGLMWVKLDDKMPDDPHIDRLSDGAFRLYISALCHAASQQTDGYVDADKATRLTPKHKAAHVAELVASGLWTEMPEGYVIRNYLKYNPSRKQREERRQRDAARLTAWREEHGRGPF